MNKKKMILSVAMIVLLPLLSALMYVGYDLYIPIILRCTELEMVRRIIVLGVPAVLIIYYGCTTGDKITSTLSGVFLIPIFDIYSDSF